jgi:hypothetical protein
VPSETLVRRGLPDALEYQRLEPENTVLYRVVQRNLETFLASLDGESVEHGKPELYCVTDESDAG